MSFSRFWLKTSEFTSYKLQKVPFNFPQFKIMCQFVPHKIFKRKQEVKWTELHSEYIVLFFFVPINLLQIFLSISSLLPHQQHLQRSNRKKARNNKEKKWKWNKHWPKIHIMCVNFINIIWGYLPKSSLARKKFTNSIKL